METKRPYKDKFQPDYIQISQMSEKLISEGNIASKGKTIQDMDEQFERIKIQISQSQLDFQPEKLYTQFISSKQSEQKMKTRTDMCPGCGKQLKKFVQCQLCGEVYCRDCCFRKRGYPVRVQQDVRSCCETCHRKFIKLMTNQDFYQQVQTLLKVFQSNKNKAQKALKKTQEKQEILNQLKQKKRGQRIKQKNLQNQILAQQRKIKKLDEEIRKVVMEKAQQIRKEQQRLKQQQLLREAKILQEERKRQIEKEALRKMEEQIQKQRSLIEKSKLQQSASRQEINIATPPSSPIQKKISIQQNFTVEPVKVQPVITGQLLSAKNNETQNKPASIKKQETMAKELAKKSQQKQIPHFNISLERQITPLKSEDKAVLMKSQKQKFQDNAESSKILSSQFSTQTKDLDNVQSTQKGSKSDIQIKGSLAQEGINEDQQQVNLEQIDLSRMSQNEMLTVLNKRNSRRNTLKKQSLVSSQQDSDYKKSQIQGLDSPQKKPISNEQKQKILRISKIQGRSQRQDEQPYTDQKGKCQCSLI